MRVLVITPAFPPALNTGGATRSAGTLAAALVRAGAEVQVVTTDCGLPAPPPRERVVGGARITTLGAWRGGGRYAFAPGLSHTVRGLAAAADVAIVQGIWTYATVAGCRACRSVSLPYVLSARGTLESVSLAEKGMKKRAYFRLVEAANLRRAAAIHFASDSERRHSEGSVGAIPSLVVPNAVEAHPLQPAGGAGLRRRLGLPAESRLLGMAGRVHPRKGYDVILPALAGCDPSLHLVLFGSDEEGHLAVVRRHARALGLGDRIHVLGHLDGDVLQQAYASIDLLVLPSLGESFGNVVLEALVQGTEAMVSDRVPVGGFVRDHGLGRVVVGLEPETWQVALEAWRRETRRWDRESASRLVQDEFGLEPIGRRWTLELSRIRCGP
jgi:glycosyltransferase involved in cell wall biosynthesis